jgi:DNA primase
MVFITGGEKDVLTLVSHGFSAVCFNSETAEISTDILDMLAMRFKHIFILYDMDDTGRKVMDKAEQFAYILEEEKKELIKKILLAEEEASSEYMQSKYITNR